MIMGSGVNAATRKEEETVEDEFDSLKPSGRPAEMERWNIDDLKAYKDKLAAEIARIDAVLDGKESVRSAADNLFKK